MKFTIKQVLGHVEVYDFKGEFQFSADTHGEAMEELRELEAA